ncbi:MAG: phosphoadenosine phosphosulfate reductase family protein [Candidatus Methanomethylophilaceae archaeon]|nr:phosphoadenosine phosphosulfate reductase family protein [Candidatus Methanomethylophilaceae archaeon]
MEPKNPANGKETCRWCDTCGTLILGTSCSVCKREGREFQINSPGDIRPCMGDSVTLVQRLFEDSFGTCSPINGRGIFLNKVPGEDRTDEIIAHGAIIGVLRFDLRNDRIVLELRQPGAVLFAPVAVKNVVRFGGMSGHLKGKTIPGSNVYEVKGEFCEGSPLILVKGQKIGWGTALVGSDEIQSAEKAVKIKSLESPEPLDISPNADLRTMVDCNRDHIRSLARRAVKEIRTFVESPKSKGLPVTVSFSGGKDSLAAYGLASKACENITLVNIDTGLEFPKTVEYVNRFSEKSDIPILTAHGGNGFWDNVDSFGPPAKDFRWCCKVCKLGPVTDLISEKYPNGTVTVEGNRWLESFARSGIGFVSRNPFVPNQINLNPIRSWRAAEVWTYILWAGLDYNPLYDRDFERIGCYLCPSCLSSEWRNTGRLHPDLYDRWERYLKLYSDKSGLPPEYVGLGFWRWKAIPPKMQKLADELGLDLKPKREQGASMDMVKGLSSCAAGGYSVESVVHLPQNRSLDYTGEMLKMLGDVKCSEEYGIALLRTPVGRAKVFGGGQITVTSPDRRNADRLFRDTLKAVVRANMCTCCGICAKSCRRHAITIDEGVLVDAAKCNGCGSCSSSCMVLHYYDKLMPEGRIPQS